MKKGKTEMKEPLLLRNREGKEIVVADSGASVGREGELQGVVFVFRDVTERQRMEEALRRSERRYRDVYKRQGRGFAVVADEVRKLAEESAHAAQRIAHLISEIQKEAERAVRSMTESQTHVEGGSEAVDKAREAFQDIHEANQVVTQEADNISPVSYTHLIRRFSEMALWVVGERKFPLCSFLSARR